MLSSRCTLLASIIALAAALPARGAEPIEASALVLVGQQGESHSEVARSVLLVGKYLYVSGEPGFQTLDVATPGAPKLIGDWKPTSHKVNGAATAGDYLYVTNWSPGAGLLVFDISNPARPKHVRTIETQAHTWTADICDGLLYVGIDSGTLTGINTYDLSDPARPKLLSFIDVKDRLVGNVARHGKHLYFAHKKWIYIYDSSDPAQPARVGEITLNGLAGKTLVRDGFLFVVSRKISKDEEGGVTVYTLDDPAHPKRIAAWSQEEPRDLCLAGERRLVVPCSGSGVYLLEWNATERTLEPSAHFYLSWPKIGKHGGYPVCAAASPDRVFIGTTGGNNPECADFSCPYRGARVYEVKLP
jgi:hypothetical protein